MGLQQNDLAHLIDSIIEIDSYKSKMGEDSDIITLAFSVHGNEPAKDLENFIEKGYPFVLDADVTSGEQSDGTYKVFVEMERNKDIPMQIIEIAVFRLSPCERVGASYSARCLAIEIPPPHTTGSRTRATSRRADLPPCKEFLLRSRRRRWGKRQAW